MLFKVLFVGALSLTSVLAEPMRGRDSDKECGRKRFSDRDYDTAVDKFLNFWNGNPDTLSDAFSPGLTVWQDRVPTGNGSYPLPLFNTDQYLEWYTITVDGFDPFAITPKLHFGKGNKVVLRWILEGTLAKPELSPGSNAPIGTKVAYNGTDILTLNCETGKIDMIESAQDFITYFHDLQYGSIKVEHPKPAGLETPLFAKEKPTNRRLGRSATSQAPLHTTENRSPIRGHICKAPQISTEFLPPTEHILRKAVRHATPPTSLGGAGRADRTLYHLFLPSPNYIPTAQPSVKAALTPVNIRNHESRASLLGGQDPTGSYIPIGGYHDREGFSSVRPAIGQRASRMYIPTSTWTWAFLIVVLIQAIIALVFEVYVFALFETSIKNDARRTNESRTVPTHLSLFIFGFLYDLLLAYDALRLRNTIQVILLCIFNLAFMIYSAIQVGQIEEAVNILIGLNQIETDFWPTVEPYLVGVPCVIAFATLLLSFIAWKLYGEFAWTIYKNISADLRLKRRLLIYQIYITLLKFDFFLFIGFTVQFIVIVIDTNDVEFYLTIAAIPVIIIILLLAGYWTRKENIFGMVCIILIYFAGLAYFLFKLVRMYTDNSRSEAYHPVRRSLTGFAVITLIFLLATIVIAIWCTTNFNKGLKPHVDTGSIRGRKTAGNIDKADTTEMPTFSPPAPTRMTID